MEDTSQAVLSAVLAVTVTASAAAAAALMIVKTAVIAQLEVALMMRVQPQMLPAGMATLLMLLGQAPQSNRGSPLLPSLHLHGTGMAA